MAASYQKRQSGASVTYNLGTVGVLTTGDRSPVHHPAVTQDLRRVTQLDLPQLADELSRLRAAMRGESKTLEDDAAVGAVAEAEGAARAGNQARALERLRAAGKWALDVATRIGVELTTLALKEQLGLPK
jgi:hypothetical protein